MRKTSQICHIPVSINMLHIFDVIKGLQWILIDWLNQKVENKIKMENVKKSFDQLPLLHLTDICGVHPGRISLLIVWMNKNIVC